MIKKIYAKDGGVDLIVRDFNIEKTFECGQCFRWDKLDDSHYIGVANGEVVEIIQDKDCVKLLGVGKDTFRDQWKRYFDLDRDYKALLDEFSTEDTMKEAIQLGNGIRLLAQNEWETLISFIISANNNIPRIKKILNEFCKLFGDKIIYKDNTYYTFPNPDKVKYIKLEDLDQIKSGYRAKYIIDAIQKINSGEVDLYNLKNMNTIKAREELLKIKGVGPKVADCILLFSMSKYECYPMDVWIKRVTEAYYFKREATGKEIQEFASKTWGNWAGLAQQYLFYYARSR